MTEFSVASALGMRRFANLVPLHLRPQGDEVAYTVKIPGRSPIVWPSAPELSTEITGGEVWLHELDTGTARCLAGGDGRDHWGPRWSPDGQKLAWFSRDHTGANIWLWRRGQATPGPISTVDVQSVWGMEFLQWTPDASGILCRLSSTAYPPAAIDTPTTQSILYEEAGIEGEQAIPAWAGSRTCDMGIIQVDSGDVRILCQRVQPLAMQLSPDGNLLAILQLTSRQGLFHFLADLLLVPVAAPEAAFTLISNTPFMGPAALAWSPSGRFIACGMPGSGGGKVLVVDVGQANTRTLPAGGGQLPVAPTSLRWSADNQQLYWVAGGALWEADLTASSTRNLTSGWPWKVNDLIGPNGDTTVWTPDGESLVVRVSDPQLCQGFGFINLRTGERLVRWEADKIYLTTTNADVCRHNNRLVFEAQAGNEPPDLWQFENMSDEPARLTDLNPQVHRSALGAPHLVRWQDGQGRPHSAACLLPPGFRDGEPYPAVIRLYDGPVSRMVRAFGLADYADNMHILAAHGYVVILPDMILPGRQPRTEVAEQVEAVIDEFARRGWIDPKRLGVLGHSYGGYLTLCLLTASARIKAAVAVAGFSDLGSGALTLYRGDAAYWMRWASEGQGRMGGPPWAQRERYTQNSPLYHFEQIQTPVLLVHGTEDAVPVWQAEAVYSGLKHLHKPVGLLRYAGEEHWPTNWSHAHLTDCWERILAWFDRWL